MKDDATHLKDIEDSWKLFEGVNLDTWQYLDFECGPSRHVVDNMEAAFAILTTTYQQIEAKMNGEVDG